jgi:anti-anti-sigma factor
MNLSAQVTEIDQDTAVIAVSGDLDLTTATLLKTLAQPLLEQAIRHLVVAAEGLNFCDVRGLRVFTGIHAVMASAGGRLSIAEPSPILQRLMEVTNQVQGTTCNQPPIAVYRTVSQARRSQSYGLRSPRHLTYVRADPLTR